MYAVIKAGGKQQKVKAGDVIEIEVTRSGDGDEITFTPILVVDDDGKTHVGKDLAKAAVRGRLLGEQKGEKVRIFKYRAKTGYAKRQGHRQTYSLVEISDVSLGRRAPRKAAAQPGDAAGGEEERPAPEAEVEGATEESRS